MGIMYLKRFIIEAELIADKEYDVAIKKWEDRCVWAKNTPRPNGKPRKKPSRPQRASKFVFVLKCMQSLEKV